MTNPPPNAPISERLSECIRLLYEGLSSKPAGDPYLLRERANTVHAKLLTLESAVAAQERDAQRYRWLRRMIFDDRIIKGGGDGSATMLYGEKLDAAIDALLATNAEGDSGGKS